LLFAELLDVFKFLGHVVSFFLVKIVGRL